MATAKTVDLALQSTCPSLTAALQALTGLKTTNFISCLSGKSEARRWFQECGVNEKATTRELGWIFPLRGARMAGLAAAWQRRVLCNSGNFCAACARSENLELTSWAEYCRKSYQAAVTASK